MQSKLKQAFMRGLCAMNLEAMDVIKTYSRRVKLNYSTFNEQSSQ